LSAMPREEGGHTIPSVAGRPFEATTDSVSFRSSATFKSDLDWGFNAALFAARMLLNAGRFLAVFDVFARHKSLDTSHSTVIPRTASAIL
jgi:hypothetical protein